jgi:hypothetical protein
MGQLPAKQECCPCLHVINARAALFTHVEEQVAILVFAKLIPWNPKLRFCCF